MLSLRPTILLFTLILLVEVVFVAADDINTTPPSEEDDNSSSEETVEDSNESRRKRSLETSLETNNKGEEGKMTGRAGIPGLPDPATILKIAQILQALGEKIVPILVEAVGFG
ncbi:antennal-specific protein OS-C isoform X2 [Ceratitis capitata]|uniref:antennal-specific protein OS-C isoform X2 n=1 Tax=Ceratitis capitata TaxID=7213 RepID=UPI00061888F2|nr:antennal-specific protein OS-C isoform X2 [Ceratitis capitata]